MEVQLRRPDAAVATATAATATRTSSAPITRSTSPLLHDEVDALLGPPPAPFPELQRVDSNATSEDTSETVYYDVRRCKSRRSLQYDDMTEINLAGMQRACVDALERLLPASEGQAASDQDQRLTEALGELLEASYELETFHPSEACCSPATPPNEAEGETPFHYLTHVLLEMQTAVSKRRPPSMLPSPGPQVESPSQSSTDLHPSVAAFREEIAYARVDSLAAAVIQLVRDREQQPPACEASPSAMPPDYRSLERCSIESMRSHGSCPPSYSDYRKDFAMLGGNAFASSSSLGNKRIPILAQDKMTPGTNDLDTVTSAIERLNSIAPQLQEQRAEMRPISASAHRRALQLQREARMRELDRIWDKIEAAHGPSRYRGVYSESEARERRKSRVRRNPITAGAHLTMQGQNVLREELKGVASHLREPTVDNSAEASMARARELRERDSLLIDLIDTASSTRLNDQDTPLRKKEQSTESPATKSAQRNKVGRLVHQDFPIPFEEFLARKQADIASPTSNKGKGKARFFNFLTGSSTSLVEVSPSAPKTPRSRRQQFLGVLSRNSSATRLDDVPEVAYPPHNSLRSLSAGSTPYGLPWDSDSPSPSTSSGSFFSDIMANGGPQPSGEHNGGETALAPLPVDVDAIGYVCEHQENLKKIAVMVYGSSQPPNLELEVATAGDAILTSKSDSTLRFHIALPTPVPLGQVAPLLPSDGFFETRINALPTPSSALTLSSTITHALSAPHLRQLAPRALCCTSCDREIAEFPSDIQFKDLPSEHWAEMLEAWMCHSDPAFTAHIAKQTKDGFWPSKNTVLVGGSYLLVADSDICETSLQLSDINQAEDWRTVTCPCSQILGKQRTTGPGTGTVRFSKWAVSLMHGRGGGDIEHTRFPPSVFVVSDMLELSQAHASHRFVISDEETNQTKLALWLFNPSMRVAYRKPNSAARTSPSPLSPAPRSGSRSPRSSPKVGHSDHAKSFRAAKVMYTVLHGGSYEHLPGFTGQVEQLSYPAEVCTKLQFALEQSSSVYPPARREFNSFSCGFLERV